MKKYKVFVDSNGKDSLWFCAGEKAENPLVPEKQETPKHEPSLEELNGEILMKMFNITGLLKNVSQQVSGTQSVQVNLEEYLPNKRVKKYTLDIRVVDADEGYYSRSVKPELQIDGSYY